MMRILFTSLLALFWCYSGAFAQGPPVGLAPLAPPPAAYMLAGFSNIPWQDTVVSGSPTYRVSKKTFRSPAYPVGPCILGNMNFYDTNAQPQENDPSANFVISGQRMVVNGASYAATWGTGSSAANNVSIAPGSGSTGGSQWSNPVFVTIPANTLYQVWTYDNMSNSTFLSNMTMNASLGEFVNYSTTSLAGVYAGTTAAGTRYSGANQGYAPMVACQGGNGNPVFLAIGDSITIEQGGIYSGGDQDGVLGTTCRIMNDTLQGAVQRWACAEAAVPGQSAGQIINAASVQRKVYFFNQIPYQIGVQPFDHLAVILGTNDVNAASSAANAEAAIDPALGVLRTAWASARMLYVGWPPRDACNSSGTGSDYFYCNPAGAITPAVNFVYPSGIGPTVLSCIAASSAHLNYSGYTTCSGITHPPDQFLSLEPFFSNTFGGGGTPGTYRQDQASWVNTLGAAVTAGTSTPLQMAYPPPALGQPIVIDAGCNNGSTCATGAYGEVFKVLWVQAGVSTALPYTVYLTSCGNGGGTFAYNHSSAAPLTTTPSCDGIHPSTIISGPMADFFAPLKIAVGSPLF